MFNRSGVVNIGYVRVMQFLDVNYSGGFLHNRLLQKTVHSGSRLAMLSRHDLNDY